MADKIKRDAFLYLEPQGQSTGKFAQCASCAMWTGDNGLTCTIHGKDVEVSGGMSCGLYVPGAPHTDMVGKEMEAVTPQESGLIDAETRCENCRHFEYQENECELFDELNESHPDKFELDETVSPKGCCNAFMPMGGMDALRRKAYQM